MSSSMCEHEIEVEDLAIGLLQGEEAENARRHLESCVACQKAQVRFVAERALFEDRKDALPPPHLMTEPEMVESVTTIVSERRNAKVLRFARTVVAFAACAAAIFMSVWVHEHSAPSSLQAAPEASSGVTPAAPSSFTSSTSSNMSTGGPVANAEGLFEEQPMACAFPMSGSFSNTPVSDLALSSALEAPASIGSRADQGTCEAPLSSSGSSMISWRVTSSFATP